MTNFVVKDFDSKSKFERIGAPLARIAISLLGLLFIIFGYVSQLFAYISAGFIIVIVLTFAVEVIIAVMEKRNNIYSKVKWDTADAVMAVAEDAGCHITGQDAAVILLGGVHRVTGKNGVTHLITTSDSGEVLVWTH